MYTFTNFNIQNIMLSVIYTDIKYQFSRLF